MKRETKLLLEKACDSLVLSIEIFNRPHDRGRVSGTLIHLDHGFEMLMKAAIIHRGCRIIESGSRETIGFNSCVQRSLSDGNIKYLTNNQALVLQTINEIRNAAQHYLLDMSESQLYVHVQSGVTIFRDVMRDVFGRELVSHLPSRVLPISTVPPTDIVTLFDSEIADIRKLLHPGKRRRIEAMARIRPLAILDATIRGENGQPSNNELRQISNKLIEGKAWSDIFRDVATVEITPDGSGHTLSLRITKKEGVPISLVPPDTDGAVVVGVKRVNELDFYNLGAKELAQKVGLTPPKVVAVVNHIGLRNDKDCYKEVRIGKSKFKRYSQKAVPAIKDALSKQSIDEIWALRPRKGSRA